MTTLLAQIRNDRYGAEYTDRYAVGWNDCSKHVERIVIGLRELRDAPALDLRLKAEMTGGVR